MGNVEWVVVENILSIRLAIIVHLQTAVPMIYEQKVKTLTHTHIPTTRVMGRKRRIYSSPIVPFLLNPKSPMKIR